jgi:hypothetical protein
MGTSAGDDFTATPSASAGGPLAPAAYELLTGSLSAPAVPAGHADEGSE